MIRLGTALLTFSLSALAQSPSLANAERLFPQGLSPITNDTAFYSRTSSRASNAGGGAFRVSEQIDLSMVPALTLGVGFEYRATGESTPEVTAKYQFLRADTAGVNAAAALKYKMVGLNPSGSEAEAILAVSRSFGPVVAMVNGVVGRGLVEPDMDAEIVAGVGTRFLKSGFVGLNGQAKFLIGAPAEEVLAAGGRPTELLGGAFVGYRFGIVEASALAGFLSPIGTAPAGPMALCTLGIAF